MSLLDRHQNNNTSEQNASASSLQMPRSFIQPTPVEQLPFPDNPALPQEGSQVPPAQYPQVPFPAAPGVAQSVADLMTPPNMTRPLTDPTVTPNGTRPLVGPITPPAFTRQLTEWQSGTLPDVSRNLTTSLRQPVIIRGSGKKSTGMRPPPKEPRKRRLVVHLAVAALLLFIVLGTLIAVVPTGNEGQVGFNIFQPIMNVVKTNGNNTGVIAQQAATATAVTQDGYDPGAQGYAGLPPAPPGSDAGGLGHFFYGQCTYWANMRYHSMTGVWVTWLGNANQWVSGAANNGWIVSATPKAGSIIVLQAGVQGAGWYGHVAVVEKVKSDGSVVTSNWNWGGAWGRTTSITFRPGPGVSFIYSPGH
jgi:surface antigen